MNAKKKNCKKRAKILSAICVCNPCVTLARSIYVFVVFPGLRPLCGPLLIKVLANALANITPVAAERALRAAVNN